MMFERGIELNGKKKEQVRFNIPGKNRKTYLRRNRKSRSKQVWLSPDEDLEMWID